MERKCIDGGKKTFFLLDAPILYEQRKRYIRKYTALPVGPCSEDDVSSPQWRHSAWKKALDKYQVMVMGSKIFADILQNDYIQFRNINLIVIDECHAGTKKGSIMKLMKMYERCSTHDRPRIVGLTASLLNTGKPYHKIGRVVTKLEKKFMCSLATISDITDVERFSSSPSEKHIPFDEPQVKSLEDIIIRIKYISDFVTGYGCNDRVNCPPFFDESMLYKDIELSRKLVRHLFDMCYNIEKLGLYGGNIAALKLMMYIQRLGAKSTCTNEALVYLTFVKLMIMFRNMLTQKMNKVREIEKIYEYSSPQVATLLEVLRQYMLGNDRCIIFVERRSTAEALCNILKTTSENVDDMKFMKPDFVVGMGFDPGWSVRRKNECDILEKQYMKEDGWDILQKFKTGETNVLVTTDIANDGLDNPECKLVVRFDLPKIYRSYILSKAWGSIDNSYYILLTPRKDKRKTWYKIFEYKSIEDYLKSILCGQYRDW